MLSRDARGAGRTWWGPIGALTASQSGPDDPGAPSPGTPQGPRGARLGGQGGAREGTPGTGRAPAPSPSRAAAPSRSRAPAPVPGALTGAAGGTGGCGTSLGLGRLRIRPLGSRKRESGSDTGAGRGVARPRVGGSQSRAGRGPWVGSRAGRGLSGLPGRSCTAVSHAWAAAWLHNPVLRRIAGCQVGASAHRAFRGPAVQSGSHSGTQRDTPTRVAHPLGTFPMTQMQDRLQGRLSLKQRGCWGQRRPSASQTRSPGMLT